jgi:hypothetical protein
VRFNKTFVETGKPATREIFLKLGNQQDRVTMSKKTLTLTILSIIALTFLITQVNAVTLVAPANGATISGLFTMTASNSSFGNMTNCTFYAKSASTAQNTWLKINVISNTTDNNATIGGRTNTSSIFEDSNNYIFNATCMDIDLNTSSAVGTATVTVNNGAPVIPSALSPASSTIITSATTPTFTSTVSDANTTSCTYTIARGGATSGSDYFTGSATYSATTCSFTKTFSATTDNGDWIWYITASDGTDTAKSSQYTYQVQIPPSGGNLGVAEELQQEATTTQDYTLIWIMGIVVVIITITIILKRK